MEAPDESLYCRISSPISPARVCPDITVSLGCDSPAPDNTAMAEVPSPAHILENSVPGTVRWKGTKR